MHYGSNQSNFFLSRVKPGNTNSDVKPLAIDTFSQPGQQFLNAMEERVADIKRSTSLAPLLLTSAQCEGFLLCTGHLF